MAAAHSETKSVFWYSNTGDRAGRKKVCLALEFCQLPPYSALFVIQRRPANTATLLQ